MLILAFSLAWDVVALRSCHNGSEGNSSVPCPDTEHHAEYQPMRQTSASQWPIVSCRGITSITSDSRRSGEYDGPGGSGNQALKPSSMRRYCSDYVQHIEWKQAPPARALYFDPSFLVHPLIF
ncbi:hypothetical protein CK203_099574 [Vitis vinifera]|uniref:Uncharacterized protein n=1 Tax=Vitis vinifera TaxID=29760 RepID=A0A438CHK2_VITVI|nr:hypothetical protein CK203_099574 [Vitis vinifera]